MRNQSMKRMNVSEILVHIVMLNGVPLNVLYAAAISATCFTVLQKTARESRCGETLKVESVKRQDLIKERSKTSA